MTTMRDQILRDIESRLTENQKNKKKEIEEEKLKLAKYYKEKDKKRREKIHKLYQKSNHLESSNTRYQEHILALKIRVSEVSQEKEIIAQNQLTRIQASAREAKEASLVALETQRKVQDYYRPKLAEREDEIKKLKLTLEETQNELRIARMTKRKKSKEEMALSQQHSSNKSLEQPSTKNSPATCSATGSQPSDFSTMEGPSASCSSRKTASDVPLLGKERQVRDARPGWEEEMRNLLKRIPQEKTEVKNRLNSELERLQMTFDKQKKDFETIVEAVLHKIKLDLWKETFEVDKLLSFYFPEASVVAEEHRPLWALEDDNRPPSRCRMLTRWERLDGTGGKARAKSVCWGRNFEKSDYWLREENTAPTRGDNAVAAKAVVMDPSSDPSILSTVIKDCTHPSSLACSRSDSVPKPSNRCPPTTGRISSHADPERNDHRVTITATSSSSSVPLFPPRGINEPLKPNNTERFQVVPLQEREEILEVGKSAHSHSIRLTSEESADVSTNNNDDMSGTMHEDFIIREHHHLDLKNTSTPKAAIVAMQMDKNVENGRTDDVVQNRSDSRIIVIKGKTVHPQSPAPHFNDKAATNSCENNCHEGKAESSQRCGWVSKEEGAHVQAKEEEGDKNGRKKGENGAASREADGSLHSKTEERTLKVNGELPPLQAREDIKGKTDIFTHAAPHLLSHIHNSSCADNCHVVRAESLQPVGGIQKSESYEGCYDKEQFYDAREVLHENEDNNDEKEEGVDNNDNKNTQSRGDTKVLPAADARAGILPGDINDINNMNNNYNNGTNIIISIASYSFFIFVAFFCIVFKGT